MRWRLYTNTSAIPKVKSVGAVGSLGFLLVLAKVRSEPRAETHHQSGLKVERQPMITNKSSSITCREHKCRSTKVIHTPYYYIHMCGVHIPLLRT